MYSDWKSSRDSEMLGTQNWQRYVSACVFVAEMLGLFFSKLHITEFMAVNNALTSNLNNVSG